MSKAGQFHHVVLQVADLDRAEQFFGETLELEPLGRDLWPEDGPNSSFLTDTGQYLVLVQVDRMDPEGPGVHTNFMVPPDRYQALYDRLKGLGFIVVDHRAEQRSVGELSTYFGDPDGHHLQITALSAEAFIVPAAGRGKVVAGRLEDFPIGAVSHIKEGKFFLVRLGDGILALNEVCTHMRCNVTYQPEHYRFYCACHYNKFTRTGAHIGHTRGTPPLHAYAVEMVDGQLVVDTDISHPRAPSEADNLVAVAEG